MRKKRPIGGAGAFALLSSNVKSLGHGLAYWADRQRAFITAGGVLCSWDYSVGILDRRRTSLGFLLLYIAVVFARRPWEGNEEERSVEQNYQLVFIFTSSESYVAGLLG